MPADTITKSKFADISTSVQYKIESSEAIDSIDELVSHLHGDSNTITPDHDDSPAVSNDEVQKVMEQYDRESVTRSYTGGMRWVIILLCIAFSAVQLYAAFTSKIPATQLRPLHLGFVLTIAYLLYPVRRKSSRTRLPWYDLILAVLSMGCCLYISLQHIELAQRISRSIDPVTQPDLWRLYICDMAVGATLILLLAEACRRVVGMPILIIAGAFVLYGLFGRSMPGFLAHRGFSVERLITHLVYTTEGIMGTPLGASSTFIFLFVLFGAFLERTQVGKFFIDLSNAVAGHKRGGPAKVAIITSALEGTVSGSSVANTVGSGSFTIPMMKKLGYRPEFAAAVEAAASTGGQIMPPVMGAAAFLMAESVGVAYSEVVKAAIIPALLYFAGIYIIVDIEAKKCGLKGMDKDKMPKLKSVVLNQCYLILPLLVIIGFLGMGYTPIFAGLVGIMSAAICGFMRHIHALILRQRIARVENQPAPERLGKGAANTVYFTAVDIFGSLYAGAKGVLGVAIACGMAGIIVGMITLTGLGLKLGNGLIDIAGGSQILTLLLTMIASIILGMGVPTTANYLITSTITAPAVMSVMGCSMLTAHMFTFYFGIVADITPPVALAAMAGAAIAKSSPLRTGVNSIKLAIAAFLIPYMFVFNEHMLFINAEWYHVLQIALTAMIGMLGIGAGLEGYFTRHAHLLQRLLFIGGGLLLIEPGLITDIAGIAIIVVAIAWQELENRKFGGRMEPAVGFYSKYTPFKRVGYFLVESFVQIARLFKKLPAQSTVTQSAD